MPSSSLPHRTRAVALGVILPAVLLLGALALVLSWRSRLPDQIAVHWGPDGVDRVGAPAELLLTIGILGGMSWLVSATLCLTVGRSALTRRMVVGISAGMGALFGGLLLAATVVQLDVSDPSTAGNPSAGAGVAIATAAAIGTAAGLLAGADPRQPSTAPVPTGARRADADSVPVWSGDASMARPWLAWLALIALLAFGGIFGFLADAWWLLPLLALPGVLLVGTVGWSARVDAASLTVTGQLGWPRQHIPANEVDRADVIHVAPFQEFGGWGLRAAVDGRTGVVTRAGAAIQVQRSGGRVFVVTTEGAAEGAALLNTMAARSRESDLPVPRDQ